MGEFEIKNKERAYLSEISHQEAEEGKKKKFRPGTHVFFKRYYFADCCQGYYFHVWEVLGGQIDVPEGYQVLAIHPVTATEEEHVESVGVDVWYINNKRVEVEPVHNVYFDNYDYSEPGKVVETMTEEMGPSLKLSPTK